MAIWDADGRVRNATPREIADGLKIIVDGLRKVKFSEQVYSNLRSEYVSNHEGLILSEIAEKIPEATKMDIAKVVGQLEISKIVEHYLKPVEGGRQKVAYKLNLGSGFLYKFDALMGYNDSSDLLL